MGDIFAVVLLVVCLFVMSIQISKVNRLNKGMVGACAGVLFAVVMYYILVPLVVIFFADTSEETYRLVVKASFDQYARAFVGCVVFVFVLIQTYQYYNRRRSEVVYMFDESKWRYVCKFFVWITYIVGGLTFLIYIRAFGGIGRMLSYAEYLRSFAYSGSNVVSYLASIMVVPARLITVTPILCFTFTGRGQRNRGLYLFVWLSSFFLSVVFMLANAGRTAIILALIIYTIPFIKKFARHPWRICILLGCLCLPILGVLDSVFKYMANGQWEYESVDVISYLPQFLYPLRNVINMGEILRSSGVRWCQDFVTGILNILPGLNFEPSYVPTSAYYGGENWKLRGGTPNDIITFGYLELGFLGIILVAIILGVIIGKIDRMMKLFPERRLEYKIVETSLVVNAFAYIINADISSLISNQVQLTIVGICVLFACRKQNVRGGSA